MSPLHKIIIRAAGDLPPTFSAEALAVRAWQVNNGAGMRDFDHPDLHKISSALCGQRGLVAKGLLERSDDHQLKLTLAGHKALAELKELPVTEGSRRALLAEEQWLKGRLESEAFLTYRQYRSDIHGFRWALSRQQAKAFWAGKPEEFRARLDALIKATDGTDLVLSDGQVVRHQELLSVKACDTLVFRFYGRTA